MKKILSVLIITLSFISCGKPLTDEDIVTSHGIVYDKHNHKLFTGAYQHYFNDEPSIIQIKCSYKNGQLNGNYNSYYKSKEIEKNWNYVNGLLDGQYISYYDNGQVIRKCNYIMGKIDGNYISYYKNGPIKRTCSYNNGRLDGSYMTYYNSGQIEKNWNYSNGKLDGSYMSYYKSGKLIRKCTYVQGKKIGDYKSYYRNGLLKDKINYNKYGETYEEHIYRYKNGRIRSKTFFRSHNGGGYIAFYGTNGKIQEKCEYKKNKLYHGTCSRYSSAGKVIDKWNFYESKSRIIQMAKTGY